MRAKCRGVLGILAATAIVAGLALAPHSAAAQGVLFDWGSSQQKKDDSGKENVNLPGSAGRGGDVIVSFGDRKLYFIESQGKAISYPIAIPREQSRWSGVTSVSQKRISPDWTPTPEMFRENPKLPPWVPGGHPMNPLGTHALYLGASTYRIHGTDAPWTIGTAASKGCVRMYNKDVQDLFPRVRVGAKVTVTWNRYTTTPSAANPEVAATNTERPNGGIAPEPASHKRVAAYQTSGSESSTSSGYATDATVDDYVPVVNRTKSGGTGTYYRKASKAATDSNTSNTVEPATKETVSADSKDADAKDEVSEDGVSKTGSSESTQDAGKSDAAERKTKRAKSEYVRPGRSRSKSGEKTASSEEKPAKTEKTNPASEDKPSKPEEKSETSDAGAANGEADDNARRALAAAERAEAAAARAAAAADRLSSSARTEKSADSTAKPDSGNAPAPSVAQN